MDIGGGLLEGLYWPVGPDENARIDLASSDVRNSSIVSLVLAKFLA